MARRFIRGDGRSAKRSTVWLGIDPTDTVMTITGGTIITSFNAAALALRPFTIVRTHLELLIFSDQAAAAEAQIGAYGGVVVSEQASAIGVSAVPTPVTDSDSDLFFAHQWMLNMFFFLDATGAHSAGRRYTIDSKAMRKVNDDQDVLFVAERSSAGAGIEVMSAGRILVKLH